MKKVAPLIVALILVLALTSCGAASTVSGESTTTTTGTTGTTGNTTVTAAIQVVLDVPRAFEASKNTPQFFQDALKEKEPLFVMFYTEDAISQEVMRSVEILYQNEKYSGVVNFLILEMEGEDEITELARDFAVGYIPFIAVLDRDGTVIFEKQGFIDEQVLEQALYSAVND